MYMPFCEDSSYEVIFVDEKEERKKEIKEQIIDAILLDDKQTIKKLKKEYQSLILE